MFRSSVLLVVGEPLAVAPLLPDYHRDERAAVTALTAEIAARLDAIVLQAESRELLAGIARVAGWTSAAPDDPAARHRRARELAAAYERLRARDPARVDAVVAEVRGYWQTLRRLGVGDPWALEMGAPARRRDAGARWAAWRWRRRWRCSALCWAGGPYRLSGVVARRVTNDEDLLSTVKLLAGSLFLFVAWSAEAAAVGWWRGARLGTAGVRRRRQPAATSRCGSKSCCATVARPGGRSRCAPSISTPHAVWRSAAARWPTPWRARSTKSRPPRPPILASLAL